MTTSHSINTVPIFTQNQINEGATPFKLTVVSELATACPRLVKTAAAV